MASEKKLNHCVFCGKELKTTKTKAYCRTCSDEPKKFSVSKEISTDEVEKKFKDSMVYCYNCGEELERSDKKIWCPECELIEIYNEITPPATSTAVSANVTASTETIATSTANVTASTVALTNTTTASTVALTNATANVTASTVTLTNTSTTRTTNVTASTGVLTNTTAASMAVENPLQSHEKKSADISSTLPPIVNSFTGNHTKPVTNEAQNHFTNGNLESTPEGYINVPPSNEEYQLPDVDHEYTHVKELFIKKRSQSWKPPDVLIKQCNQVKFNVLLHLPKQQQSNIGVTLISKDIDKGQSYFGNFKCIHNTQEFHLYCCQLPIPTQFLASRSYSFHYKYAMIIKEGKKRKFEEEDLSHYKDCEWRAVSPAGNGQIIHRYDAVLIPKDRLKLFKFWQSPASDSVSNAVSFYMDWICLYQQKAFIETQDSDVENEARNKGALIASVLSSIKHCKMFTGKKTIDLDDSLVETIDKKFLEKIADLLKETKDLQKFTCGLIFAHAFFQIKLNKKCWEADINSSVEVLSSFCIPFKKFSECCSLVKKFSHQFKNNILLSIVIDLCRIAISASRYEWMGALPLLHIIKHDRFIPQHPYSLPITENDIEACLFCGLESNIKHIYNKGLDKSLEACNLVAPYFPCDWLMPRAFVMVTPLNKLIQYVRDNKEMSSFACWKLGFKYFSNKVQLDSNKVEELKNLMECLYTILEQEVICKEEINVCYKGANKILITVAELQNHALLFGSIKLYLLVLSKINWPPEQLSNQLSNACNKIHTWIERIFGIQPQMSQLLKELQCWNPFFQIYVCEEMKSLWMDWLLAKLYSRLEKYNVQTIMKLFQHDTDQKLCPPIVDTMLQHVTYSISNIQEQTTYDELLSSVTNCPTSAVNNKVLSSILSTRYPNHESVTFVSLFWSSWPKCLEIYEKLKGSGQLVSSEETCESAVSMLTEFFGELSTRRMTPTVLDNISKAGNIVEVKSIISSFLSLKIFSKVEVTIADLQAELNSYDEFKTRLKKIQHFVHIFAELAEDESTKIAKVLEMDYTMVPVCDLWIYEDSKTVFKYCTVSVPYETIQNVFYLTHHEQLSSSIFLKLFETKKALYHASKGNNNSLEAVINELWQPTKSEFSEDLAKLRDGLKLPLNKVESLFIDIYQLEKIKEELEKWCDAVEERNKNWVRDAAQKVMEYHELCRYSYSAQTIMQLKEKLKLKGDFSVVETLLPKQESAKETMTLHDVRNTAAETADILKDIADVPRRRNCLEAFCSCIELVYEVRGLATNFGQFQNMIQIANQTMEGDLIRQLFQDLLKFGSAFAPLIFDVTEDQSCEILMSKCKTLWKFVDENPNLKEIIESCFKRMADLKKVKDSLSNFQKNNVEQMTLMNTRGIYEISANPGQILHSTEDCVNLRVVEPVNQKTYVYRLDQLRELQSKLVLVAAENADNVRKFIEILSKIERIAVLLIKLQKAGFVDYTHFRLECGCSQYKKAEFDKRILKMETDLNNWEKSVQNHRRKYPHLNYYISQQLLDLQQELGKLKNDPKSNMSVKLKQLLLSVTTQPDQATVINAIENVAKKLSTDPSSSLSPPAGTSSKEKASINTLAARLDPTKFIDEQKQIYNTLTEEEGYKAIIVLKAFMECGQDADEDTLRDWCTDNESKYKDEEDIVFSDPSTDIDEEDVTEDDPLVQELIDEAYSTKIAIEAVKKAKGDPQKARENASALDLGKSIEPSMVDKDEWSASKFALVPLTVEMNVPENKYISLRELGEILSELAYCSPYDKTTKSVVKQRIVHKLCVETGKFNLISVDEASVWKAVLSLYMSDPKQPLPTYEEIVICTNETTVEEVTLLWHRAVNDEDKKRLFCLVNADKLPFQVSEEVINNLELITQGSQDFRIVIFVTTTDQARNHVSSRLSSSLRKLPKMPSDEEISSYILSHVNINLNLSTKTDQEREIMNSLASSVHVIISTRSGMGKTLRVKRMGEMLKQASGDNPSSISVPIHGPDINVKSLLENMQRLDCMQDPTDSYPQLIHFNVAQSMVESIDWLLFKVLILGGLADNYGNVWKLSSKQICVVECTLAKLQISENEWTNKQTSEPLPSVYTFLSLFPKTLCVPPSEALNLYKADKREGHIVLMDESVFREKNTQRVYRYLKLRAEGNSEVDEKTKNKITLDKFSFDEKYEKDKTPKGKMDDLVNYMLQNMSSNTSRDPSWAEIGNFIQFLSFQLHDCENSVFCKYLDVSGLKEFVVRFSILMAKEFTEPSLNISQFDEDLGSITESNLQDMYKISKTRQWDTCSHPYLFFNQDGCSITFMGLIVDDSGNLKDFRTKQVIQEKYLDTNLLNILKRNGVSFQENYNEWDKGKMILKLMRVMGINEQKYKKGNEGKGEEVEVDTDLIDPDSSYALTVDNLMKMLAIHMKFRCGIPVIMMGETGCGKTRLLRYLCELQEKAFGIKTLIILKVHGGIDEERIYAEVDSAIKKAIENKKEKQDGYTVLFFDEVNTTEALGLVKEVMCDRTLQGKPIPDELKFAAACNPYKIHDEETIKSLQSAGLGFYLRDEERIPKLGNIPLRKLVYRVLPLPQSMYQYVYDFGSVSGGAENEYIMKIVKYQLSTCAHVNSNRDAVCKVIINILCECQSFMRNQKNECKYVSLRDVVRAMILFKWFLDKLITVSILKDKINELIDDQKVKESINDISRSIIYSICVSYYARLTDREPFVRKIVSKFENPYIIPGENEDQKVSFFLKEVDRIQTVVLNEMNVSSNIAHNSALRENVFMMFVCIENRLPLFIVGKPGSSKSLAKSIVADSMRGQYCSNQLLKNFKQVQLFPYQCNQFSTTNTLIEIFQEAMKFQESQGDHTKFASVVVLEEIGLAEDAPGLPLKVLHPYLEDGTAGTNPDEVEIKPEQRVAFIGISNWALDPAKMNRGIMVIRCPPVQEELLKSAYGIANIVQDSSLKSELTKSFSVLATMYRNICSKQEESIDQTAVERGEVREFFGLRDFYTMIKMLCWKCIEKNAHPSPEDYRRVILRNFSGHRFIEPLEEIPNTASLISIGASENEKLDLIKESLKPLKIDQGENAPKQDNRYLLFITENQSALNILQTELLKNETPYVFYGSSFPKDAEYTQVCVNINKIKVCMEKGIPVVLLNYEQIYESLYDVLNQCYTELPTGRYVDLGLKSHRIKCRVDSNFRLIIIAEKDRVFTQFPTALINRLEKHFVVSETILTSSQKQLATKLRKWVDDISKIDKFTPGDSFVGYQEDTAASVILHTSHNKTDADNDDILNESIDILLQTASIDALARLKSNSARCNQETIDKAFATYFEEQKHFSLLQCLQSNILGTKTAVNIQITTFGPLLAQNYTKNLEVALNIDEKSVYILQLSEFETEMDFCNEIKETFESTYSDKKLLIIQSNFGDSNIDLIACARHRLMDERRRATVCGITHVVFIVQLSRKTNGTAFTSFQGGPWMSIHIDELTCPAETNEIVKWALSNPLHSFVQLLVENNDQVPESFKVCSLVKSNIQVAVSKLVSAHTYQQMERIIDILLEAISDKVPPSFDMSTFTGCLLIRIEDLLKQEDETIPNPEKWAVNSALNRNTLQASYTLINSIKKIVDKRLQSILTYIIASIDRFSNLDIVVNSDDTPYLKKLWLSLFNSKSFLQFSYEHIATSSIPSTAHLRKINYNCKFPFSWEIIEHVNSVFEKIIRWSGQTENEKMKTFRDLVDAASSLSFYDCIDCISLELSSKFYDYYIHDFIRNLGLPFSDEHIESVYEIVEKVLRSVVKKYEPASTSNEPFPLVNVIAGIHLAHSLIEREMSWFAELSENFPELPSLLIKRQLLSSDKIVFHFEAAQCVIEYLLPEKMEWNEENMKKWILEFHSNRSAVESLLYIDGHDDISKDLLYKCRSSWQKVTAVVLLAEHVISQLTPDIKLSVPNNDRFIYLKRYTSLLKNTKFSDPKILLSSGRQIQAILKALPEQCQPRCQLCRMNLAIKDIVYLPCEKNHIYCKKCFQDYRDQHGPRCPNCNTPIPRQNEFPIPEEKKRDYELLKQVQQHCSDFFMELVSQCCFSSIAPEKPTEEFFKQLLEIVTDTEQSDFKDLFPFEEEYSHSCPITRSVLLQLLLQYNPEQVKKKLQEYQNFIRKKFGEEYVTGDQELTLLSVKSLEDGLYKQNVTKLTFNDQLKFGIACLEKALSVIMHGDLVDEYRKTISVEFMQCIAEVRFGLCFAAELFYKYYCNSTKQEREKLPRATKELFEELIETVKTVTLKSVLREPRDFLAKQIVRCYGRPYLMTLGEQSEFEWLVPESSKAIDTYIVTGVDYTMLRAKWIHSKFGFKKEDYNEEFKTANSVVKELYIMLTLYRSITQYSESSGHKDLLQYQNKVKDELGFGNDSSLFCVFKSNQDSEMIPGEILFAPLQATLGKALSDIVVQFTLVVGALSSDKMFTPFLTILTQTDRASNMYWPTVPDDILDIVIESTKGTRDTWWKCPNGHDYFVQNCGRPVVGEVTKCFCGASIGGIDTHVPREDNTKVSGKPIENIGLTKRGHFLDLPESRTTQPTFERDMLPLSNCIMRILVHAVCIWVASSNNKVACADLAKVVVQDIPLDRILNFFWQHFEKDFQTLCRALQCSFDDSILFMSSLIHNMLSITHEDINGVDFFLTSRKTRPLWEQTFDKLFLTPFTKDVKDHIETAKKLVFEDSPDDELKMIYETAIVESTNVMNHLWIYRPQITIDHVAQSLQQNEKTELRVLKEFLKKAQLLSVLQYLPDIVQLIFFLHELCHHRIDEKDAKISLQDFIQTNIYKAYQREKVMKWSESYCIAWNKFKQEIPSLSPQGLNVPSEYIKLDMSLNQPLAFFVPIKKGEGVCSIALACSLARLQNDFIDLAWAKLQVKSIRRKQHVYLSKIQDCQMISFENQLSHVIFSHCKYSLKAGHGADITYDFVALEKHILDRFVRGKPLITCDIPIMSYRSDVLEATTFMKIRKTITQEPLPQREKDVILRDMLKKQNVQECIDTVNVALGFVQYSNWKSNTLLKRYMGSLKMDGRLPKTIEDRCELSQIISLWRILGVEQAKQIIKGNEDPFPSIKDAFKEPLTDEQRTELKTALGAYDIDQFLEIFFEFITTQVKSRQEFEAEESLVEAYVDMGCDYFGLEKIAGLEENFPTEFSLQHVTEIWKYAVEYQQDQLLKHK